METHLVNLVLLDLKYCERCGGLWLRPSHDDAVYCRSCAAKLAEFPVVRPARLRRPQSSARHSPSSPSRRQGGRA